MKQGAFKLTPCFRAERLEAGTFGVLRRPPTIFRRLEAHTRWLFDQGVSEEQGEERNDDASQNEQRRGHPQDEDL